MIRLRDVTSADSDRMFRWRNLPDVAAFMYTDRPIPREEHDAWFAAMLVDPRRRYWIIEVDGLDVGVTNLVGIEPRHRRAEWAIYLAEPGVRGRGIGAAAGLEVLKVVFDSMGYERLSVEVFAFNDAALHLYESLGFRREGVLRHHVVRGDRHLDVVLLAILRSEWPSVRERLLERQQARAREMSISDAARGKP